MNWCLWRGYCMSNANISQEQCTDDASTTRLSPMDACMAGLAHKWCIWSRFLQGSCHLTEYAQRRALCMGWNLCQSFCLMSVYGMKSLSEFLSDLCMGWNLCQSFCLMSVYGMKSLSEFLSDVCVWDEISVRVFVWCLCMGWNLCQSFCLMSVYGMKSLSEFLSDVCVWDEISVRVFVWRLCMGWNLCQSFCLTSVK